MSNRFLLEAKNIIKTFPPTVALNDVHFCLRPGEIHGLMGENGSGKSTMCSIVSGIYPYDSGELFLDGEPVKIDDLAKNLIRLSGYTLGVNMEIKYTGLRPGEKLYEELLMKEEGLQETDNKLIHIGKPIEFDKENFFDNLEKLKEEAYSETGNIRESLKKVVDTYHPNEH